MKTNDIFCVNYAHNYSDLVTTCKGANQEVKEAKNNIFFFVRLLNKLAKKNEYVSGVNILDLGKKVRAYAIQHGYDVKPCEYFTAYPFASINGVSCYKKSTHKKASSAFQNDVDITIWAPVKLSENGLIAAYKYILGIEAKEADKTAKETAKVARKAANDAKAKARKELKKQQAEAIKAFQCGEMPLNVFEEIMKKAA